MFGERIGIIENNSYKKDILFGKSKQNVASIFSKEKNVTSFCDFNYNWRESIAQEHVLIK